MYEIMLKGKKAGQAQVEREGLYYRFTCECVFSDGKMHRIVVSDGERTVNLGVCIPCGEQYCLSTKVPVKYLPGEKLCFTVDTDRNVCISVASGKPFDYLHKLETARLQLTNGQPYIVID